MRNKERRRLYAAVKQRIDNEVLKEAGNAPASENKKRRKFIVYGKYSRLKFAVEITVCYNEGALTASFTGINCEIAPQGAPNVVGVTFK